jgi:hypothetical protein
MEVDMSAAHVFYPYSVQWWHGKELIETQVATTPRECAAIMIGWLQKRSPLPGERITVGREYA